MLYWHLVLKLCVHELVCMCVCKREMLSYKLNIGSPSTWEYFIHHLYNHILHSHTVKHSSLYAHVCTPSSVSVQMCTQSILLSLSLSPLYLSVSLSILSHSAFCFLSDCCDVLCFFFFFLGLSAVWPE